jgi:subtilisin family serine protease
MFATRRPAIVTLALLGVIALALLTSATRQSAALGTTTVIVQLSGDPVVVAQHRAAAAGQNFDALAYQQQVVAEQNRFLQRVSAAGIQYVISSVSAPNGDQTTNIQFRYNWVYNGVSLNVSADAIPKLEKIPGVVAVKKDEPMSLHLDRAVNYVRAPQLYGDTAELTPFDDVRNGLEGQGMIVAVIDTGVDWTHPMFGGDPSPPQFGVGPAVAAANTNKKVIYYLNLTAGVTGDDFGHGTHVAADIAGYLGRAPGADGLPGTADDISIHGVAPQARIMAYKSLTGVGTGVQNSTMLAVEDAVRPFTLTGVPKPVPHVINLSLGNKTNDPNDPSSVACDNATLAGVTVVASAGNEGTPTATNLTGEATLGSPGTGKRVITVGANIDPGAGPHRIDELGGDSRTFGGFIFAGSPEITADITANYVFCGLGDTPDQIPDSVSGRIALIQRGSTATVPVANQSTGQFASKVSQATAKGAIAVIIYNNVDGELTNGTVRKAVVPAIALSKKSGEDLKSAIGSTAFGAVSINKIRINRSVLFSPVMADFSSRGPVGGFAQVKPDVVAPGVAVLSATVRAGGAEVSTAALPPAAGWMFDPFGYTSASGTSFSSPITAGVAALIKQAHPGWTPPMIRAALVNTATNLRNPDGSAVADGVNSLNEQGGGLIDAFAAANATALLGVGNSPLVGGAPGTADFFPSHSFGAVPIAGVTGSATLSQIVNVYDFGDGLGAGTYELSASNVRGVDGTNVQVSITDAAGNPVTSVAVPANGSGSFNVTAIVNGETIANPTQIQWYVTANRTDGGQRLRMPFYYRAVAPTVSLTTPLLNNVGSTEISGTPPLDINGSYQLQFAKAATGNAPAKLRVQESADNGANWTTLADVDAAQTTYDITDRSNGNYTYRVLGLFAVQYGLMQGPASATKAVQVDRRLEADVTSLIQTAMSGVVFAGGIFEFDQTLKNKSADTTLYPLARLRIVSIQSGSGTVRVSNADNGGDGVNSPAEFSYSDAFGFDLAPGETSAAKRLKFSDPAAEMFTFTVVVLAHLPDPSAGSSAANRGPDGGGSSSGGTSSAGSSSQGSALGTLVQPVQAVLRFTANPLTRTVKLN